MFAAQFLPGVNADDLQDAGDELIGEVAFEEATAEALDAGSVVDEHEAR